MNADTSYSRKNSNPFFIGYNSDGQPEYRMPNDEVVDGYELIEMGYQQPLGDNPSHVSQNPNQRLCNCSSGFSWVKCQANSQYCG